MSTIYHVEGSVVTSTPRSHLPRLRVEELRDDQRAIAERILKVSTLGLGGPYSSFVRSPVLGQHLFELFDYLRWKTSVPHRLNEFAILIVARIWRSQVEWCAHAPIATRAGLAQHVIDDLAKGGRPGRMASDEAAVYDFVDQMVRTHHVAEDVFQAAYDLLGEQGLVDLTTLTGAYVTAAMLIALGGEQPPEGQPLPFAREEAG